MSSQQERYNELSRIYANYVEDNDSEPSNTYDLLNYIIYKNIDGITFNDADQFLMTYDHMLHSTQQTKVVDFNDPCFDILRDSKQQCNKQKPFTENCLAINRIIHGLTYYNTLNIEKYTDDQNHLIEFCKRVYTELLNDYIHLMTEHSDSDNLQDINQSLVHNYNISCDMLDCALSLRHNRRRNASRTKVNKSVNAKYHFYVDIFDTLHYYLIHLYQAGLRIKQDEINHITTEYNQEEINENEDNYDCFDFEFFKLKTLIKQKSKTSDLLENSGHNKFNITFAKQDSTFTSAMLELSIQQGTAKHLINKLNHFLQSEEYDTDSITDDIKDVPQDYYNDKTSNIAMLIDDEPILLSMQNFVANNNLSSSSFSIGLIFYYWPYYKKKSENKNSTAERSDFTNINDHSGYDIKDLYVERKYESFKSEILESKYIKTSDYNELVMGKAKQYLVTDHVKRTTAADGDWMRFLHYDIEKDEPLGTKHLISIILYCDWTDLCTEFSSTFRANKSFETLPSIKARNQEYWWFSKTLRETVQFYGDNKAGRNYGNTWVNVTGPFFTGISVVMAIPEFNIRLCSPTSTSRQIAVATRFGGAAGMIIQVNNNGDAVSARYLRCFNCSWVSQYSEEEEWLFIGGDYHIRIESIRHIKTVKNFGAYIKPLFYFDAMISGSDPHASGCDISPKDIKMLFGLMNAELWSVENKFPEYVLDTFHLFCLKKTQIILNLSFMDLYFGSIRELIMHGIERDDLNWKNNKSDINLFKSNMLMLFNNVQEIIIYSTPSILGANYSYSFSLICLLQLINQSAVGLKITIIDHNHSWLFNAANSSIQSFKNTKWNMHMKTRHNARGVKVDCVIIDNNTDTEMNREQSVFERNYSVFRKKYGVHNLAQRKKYLDNHDQVSNAIEDARKKAALLKYNKFKLPNINQQRLNIFDSNQQKNNKITVTANNNLDHQKLRDCLLYIQQRCDTSNIDDGMLNDIVSSLNVINNLLDNENNDTNRQIIINDGALQNILNILATFDETNNSNNVGDNIDFITIVLQLLLRLTTGNNKSIYYNNCNLILILINQYNILTALYNSIELLQKNKKTLHLLMELFLSISTNCNRLSVDIQSWIVRIALEFGNKYCKSPKMQQFTIMIVTSIIKHNLNNDIKVLLKDSDITDIFEMMKLSQYNKTIVLLVFDFMKLICNINNDLTNYFVMHLNIFKFIAHVMKNWYMNKKQDEESKVLIITNCCHMITLLCNSSNDETNAEIADNSHVTSSMIKLVIAHDMNRDEDAKEANNKKEIEFTDLQKNPYVNRISIFITILESIDTLCKTNDIALKMMKHAIKTILKGIEYHTLSGMGNGGIMNHKYHQQQTKLVILITTFMTNIINRSKKITSYLVKYNACKTIHDLIIKYENGNKDLTICCKLINFLTLLLATNKRSYEALETNNISASNIIYNILSAQMFSHRSYQPLIEACKGYNKTLEKCTNKQNNKTVDLKSPIPILNPQLPPNPYTINQYSYTNYQQQIPIQGALWPNNNPLQFQSNLKTHDHIANKLNSTLVQLLSAGSMMIKYPSIHTDTPNYLQELDKMKSRSKLVRMSSDWQVIEFCNVDANNKSSTKLPKILPLSDIKYIDSSFSLNATNEKRFAKSKHSTELLIYGSDKNRKEIVIKLICQNINDTKRWTRALNQIIEHLKSESHHSPSLNNNNVLQFHPNLKQQNNITSKLHFTLVQLLSGGSMMIKYPSIHTDIPNYLQEVDKMKSKYKLVRISSDWQTIEFCNVDANNKPISAKLPKVLPLGNLRYIDSSFSDRFSKSKLLIYGSDKNGKEIVIKLICQNRNDAKRWTIALNQIIQHFK
eukprot:100136_1